MRTYSTIYVGLSIPIYILTRLQNVDDNENNQFQYVLQVNKLNLEANKRALCRHIFTEAS